MRAQILQALAEPQVTVRGLSGQSTGDTSDGAAATMQVRVNIEGEGNAAALLDGLVGGYQLERGVRATSWQADDSDPYDQDELDTRPSRWRRVRWRRATHDD